MSEVTKDWEKYLRGKKYNNSLTPNYYDTVNTNIAFVSGDQWRNVEANGQPTPTFNIMKRAITFFVSFITSSKVKIKLSPLAYNEGTEDQEQLGQQHASEIATNEIENLFEKFKMENKIRDGCNDSATMGEVGCHMYFDAEAKPYNGMLGEQLGEIDFELIDGTNIFLGNANNGTISTKVQPYVQISGRDMVETLKAEAKAYKSGEADKVESDTNTQDQAGDMSKVEIEGDEWGKALYIITYKYDKETKTIKSSKCTETAYMWKDVDTGLENYPVSLFRWEKQKNQYHGRALATGMIPNQIFINKMFAMVMYHLMMSAFPKVIYDKSKISDWDNTVGGSIGLTNFNPGDTVRNAAEYMQPGNMSNQITQVIDMAIKYTKETLGINDNLMGDVNAEQASGAAIATSVRQSSIPLENPKANMYEWIEDIGKILVDMMGTYYGERSIVLSKQGVKSIENYDFSVFKNLWLSINCDVGASTYYSEIAQVNMLNQLLQMKDPLFDMITYLESLPEEYASKELVDKVKQKQQQLQQMQQQQMEQQQAMQQAQQGQQQEQQAQLQGQQEEQAQGEQQAKNDEYEQLAQFLESLPKEVQAKIMRLPPEQQEATLKQLMKQDVNNSMKAPTK